MTSVDLITTVTASPFFNFQLFNAAASDYALDNMLTNANGDVRHYASELDFFDDSRKLVACGKRHECFS